MAAVIVITRWLFAGETPGETLERLAGMAESHRALLIEIEASDSKTLYLATAYLEVNSERYEGIVQGGVYLDHRLDYFRENSADLTLVLLNKRLSEQSDVNDKFVDLFSSYDLTGKRIRLLEYIEGVAYANLPKLIRGRIDHPISYDRTEFRCDVTVDDSFYIDIPPRVILKDNYPNAPESSLGKRIPWVFGELWNLDYPFVQNRGVPAWPIDVTIGTVRSHGHEANAIYEIYEVREGYLCKVTMKTVYTTDSDLQAKILTRRRELLLHFEGHEVIAGSPTNPERLYDKSDTASAALASGNIVELLIPPLSKLGDMVNDATYPRCAVKISSPFSGSLVVKHKDKTGGTTTLDTITAPGTHYMDINETSIDNWDWAEDRIRLEVSGATCNILEVWLELRFDTNTRLGQPRWIYEDLGPWREATTRNEANTLYRRQYWSERAKDQIAEELPLYLVGLKGYEELGALKDIAVDVIQIIHEEMLDTDKFEIGSTEFAAAKAAAISYYGSGLPRLSLPLFNATPSKELIAEICRGYGFLPYRLPTGASTWKQKICLLYHELDVVSADHTIERKDVKNLKVLKTDPGKVINEIICRFDYDWGSGNYVNEHYIRKDPDSGTWESDPSDATRHTAAENSEDAYGTYSKGYAVELKYNMRTNNPTNDSNQALAAMRWHFDYFHLSRNAVEFELFKSDLLIGETIELASEFDTGWGSCYGVSWSGKVFRVLGLGFSDQGVHWRRVYAEEIPASL